MKPRLVFRKRIVVGMLLIVALPTVWAVASNMGFELNFGTIQAVNRLLLGSGVSFDATVDESFDPPTPALVVELDPCNREPMDRSQAALLEGGYCYCSQRIRAEAI